jgi:hypothetical protein
MSGPTGPALQASRDIIGILFRGRRAPAGQSFGPLGLKSKAKPAWGLTIEWGG